jgi:hypothetical protein
VREGAGIVREGVGAISALCAVMVLRELGLQGQGHVMSRDLPCH